jgi:hypothetical protein
VDLGKPLLSIPNELFNFCRKLGKEAGSEYQASRERGPDKASKTKFSKFTIRVIIFLLGIFSKILKYKHEEDF